MSFHLLPIAIDVDGARVEIFEVMKYELPSGDVIYRVTCRIIWRGIKTRVFSLDAKDMDDFRKRVEIEIAKMKMMYLIGGRELVEEVVSR